MTSLFRYLPAKYAQRLIALGEVRFQTLTHFQRLEADGVRSDPYEGALTFRPAKGIELTYPSTGNVQTMDRHFFAALAHSDDIFVYCLSRELSAELAERFGCDTCVEIVDPAEFIRLIERSLKRRPSKETFKLVHDRVKYLGRESEPLDRWTKPDKIAMQKLYGYVWQLEYRIAYGIREAFKFDNVDTWLLDPDAPLPGHAKPTPKPRTTYLGNIARLCKVHRFPITPHNKT